jgi:hypothetical protein
MKDHPESKRADLLKELIHVEVELYGLTIEDIDYLIKNGLARILRTGGESNHTILQQ